MSLPEASLHTGDASFWLTELEAVLVPLVPALERLREAQLEQRRAVVAGDLSGMVVVNTAIEETSARIALLEQRRQAIQTRLEVELRVQGLRAVLKVAHAAHTDKARLGRLVVQVARLIRDLREQGGRNGELLAVAIEVAQHTRRIVERHSGADSIYDPVKARRRHMTRQARASLTTTTTPATPPGQKPDGVAEDAASSSLSREAP